MSRTMFVEYRGCGFWAYDVAMGIFLKHLIAVAEPLAATSNGAWIAEAVTRWRVNAVISDFGLHIDEEWSAEQIDIFIGLAEQACSLLGARDRISADEITAWPILDDMRIFPRGATEVLTAPVVELGKAIIAVANGTLSPAPAGTWWLFGTPEGRDTIRRRQ